MLPEKAQLTAIFRQDLVSGRHYERIDAARQQAAVVLAQPIRAGNPLTKIVDEAMEAAVVQAATALIGVADNPHQAYDRLVKLLAQQPRLGVRTSTSVMQQAYSTPIPIAFLAATLADIQPQHWVYEPTAGNGALLMTANPDRVIANELNPDRWAELNQRGFSRLTQADALSYDSGQSVDRVIANPPFGSLVASDGGKQKFQTFETFTTQIDQVIAFRALAKLKDNGKAVLILGSKLGQDMASRSNRYHSRESRSFYKQLYDRYNVIDHFTLSGDLYRKQGAGFPIDLIVIDGRGPSTRRLPAADVPKIYNCFEQLKQEKLPNVHIQPISQSLDTRRRSDPPILHPSPDDDHCARSDAVLAVDGTADGVDDPGMEYSRQPDRGASTDRPDNSDIAASPGTANADGSGLAQALGTDPHQRLPRVHMAERNWAGGIPLDRTHTEHGELSSVSRDPRRSASGDVAHRITASDLVMAPDETIETVQESKQVAYIPCSQAPAIGTLIPINMAAPAQAAFARFTQTHGNIDDYLVAKLRYDDRADLYQYFSVTTRVEGKG